MNKESLKNAIANIDAELVSEARNYTAHAGGEKSRGLSFLKPVAFAVVFLLLVTAGIAAAIILPQKLNNRQSGKNEPVLNEDSSPSFAPAVTSAPVSTETPQPTSGQDATAMPVPVITDELPAAETPAATGTAAQSTTQPATATAAQSTAHPATATAAPSATQPATATSGSPRTPSASPERTATPPVTPDITATPYITATPNVTPTAAPTGHPVAGSLYNLSAVLRSGAMARAGLTGSNNYSEQNIDAKLAEFEAYVRQRSQTESGNKYSSILASIDRAKKIGLINNNAVVSNEFVDANLIATDSFVLLSVDGHFYMPLDDMTVLVTCMAPIDYDHNGTSDLLLSAVASPFKEMLLVFDRTAKQFTRIYSADNNFPSLMLSMLDGNVYAFNYRTDIGGKIAFNSEGNCFVGGMPAAEFLKQVIADQEFDYYQIPDLKYSTPVPATPVPTPGSEATPVPSGATPVPDDDPLNMFNLTMRYSFLEVHQEGKPWNYYHTVREHYTFDGEKMCLDGPYPYTAVTDWMNEYLDYYKKQEVDAISVSRPFELEVIEGGKIESVDVFGPDGGLVAGGFDIDGFNALLKDGALPFSVDPDTGRPLLCFAVFTIKVTGHYIEATGQNEYAIKYQMVPLEP